MSIELELESGLEESLTEEQAEALQALVEDTQEVARRHEEMREKLAQVLIKRRDSAVKYRAGSGIERQWAEDQAYYEGEEDSGRTDYYKGMTLASPLIARPKNAYKSKVFLNITRPYVETAASKVIEVLSPVDDRAFSVQASPIPFAVLDGQVIQGQAIPPAPAAQAPQDPAAQEQEMLAAAQQGMPPPGQTMINADGQPATPQEVAGEQQYEQQMAKVRAAAKGAEVWIDDALQESGYNSELRRLIDDAARLGTGIMRGPIPTVRYSSKMSEGAQVMVEEIIPQSKCISVWNAYPDPACGDDIHKGQYFIEYDQLVEQQVRELMGAPGYIPEALEKVIAEGPQRSVSIAEALAPHTSTDPEAKRFDVWYYHGFLAVDDLVAMGCVCGEVEGGVPAVITIINDTPVKAHLAPLSKGRFPYDMMCWQRTAGRPWGIGIARQIRACQAILNSHVRAMMENAGLSSGPQIVIGRGSIVPADNKWEITPRKVWLLKPDADIPDVSKAFGSFAIESTQAELLQAIDFALKMAENVTGMPILLQGQQGPQGVPETVGGMQILVANASSLLRRIARIFDDSITKPHVTRYYEWMMEFGEDESIKGDFQIIPRGSSALVAKDMRATFLMQAVPQMIVNPAFGIDPARYFKQVAKLNGLDAEDIQFTAAEMAALMQQPPLPDPRVQVAQINAETRLQVAGMDQQTDVLRIQKDTDRDTAYVTAENQRTQTTMATKMAELNLRRELAMLDYANKNQLTIEQIKAKLAVESGRMDLQRELAVLGRVEPEQFQAENIKSTSKQIERGTGTTPQVATPAVEPPGRASPGQAFVE